jgi:hypothetical protein
VLIMLKTPEPIVLELDPSRVRNSKEISVLAEFSVRTRTKFPLHAYGDDVSLKTIVFSSFKKDELIGFHANWPTLAIFADATRDGYHELRRALSCLEGSRSWLP